MYRIVIPVASLIGRVLVGVTILGELQGCNSDTAYFFTPEKESMEVCCFDNGELSETRSLLMTVLTAIGSVTVRSCQGIKLVGIQSVTAVPFRMPNLDSFHERLKPDELV